MKHFANDKNCFRDNLLLLIVLHLTGADTEKEVTRECHLQSCVEYNDVLMRHPLTSGVDTYCNQHSCS